MCALNVSCAVCKEAFKTSDHDIYSTSCGHIFHFMCMNQWRAKSTSCPLCRSYNPTSHVIYFHFDDFTENPKVVEDLKAKLKNLEDKYEKIKMEKGAKEKKIDDVKRLYNVSEQWRGQLQDKLHDYEREREIQKGTHSKELESKANEIGLLKMCIQQMENGNGAELMYGKINEFSEENLKLKKSIQEKEASEFILNHKLEILEQRLTHLTSELQKQIALNISEGKENIISQHLQSTRRNRSKTMQHLAQLNNATGDVALKKSHTDDTNIEQPKERATLAVSHPNDYKVVITGISIQNLVHPLNATVMLLASKMSIPLAYEDIRNVNLVHHKNNVAFSSHKIVLYVEFSSIDVKEKFLAHKNRLKFHADTSLVNIKQFIDDATYPIFMYANNRLRGRGYGYVACKGNKVIAKRHHNDKEEVIIENKSDVDDILFGMEYLRFNARGMRTGLSMSSINSLVYKLKD